VLCGKLCRVRGGGGLVDNIKRGWKFFTGSARALKSPIFVGIGLGLLVSAVVAQGISLELLERLNETKGPLGDVRLRLADMGDRWGEVLGDAVKLRSEALELREKVMSSEGTEEEINRARARIQEIEIVLEEVEAQGAAIEASMGAIEARVVWIEAGISVLEEAIDYDWRRSSLLLSIGILVFSCGLALWIYEISRERT